MRVACVYVCVCTCWERCYIVCAICKYPIPHPLVRLLLFFTIIYFDFHVGPDLACGLAFQAGPCVLVTLSMSLPLSSPATDQCISHFSRGPCFWWVEWTGVLAARIWAVHALVTIRVFVSQDLSVDRARHRFAHTHLHQNAHIYLSLWFTPSVSFQHHRVHSSLPPFHIFFKIFFIFPLNGIQYYVSFTCTT